MWKRGKLMTEYSDEDLDWLVDTDPIKLLAITFQYKEERDLAKRLLFKMIQSVEQGRTAVNEIMFHTERLFGENK